MGGTDWRDARNQAVTMAYGDIRIWVQNNDIEIVDEIRDPSLSPPVRPGVINNAGDWWSIIELVLKSSGGTVVLWQLVKSAEAIFTKWIEMRPQNRLITLIEKDKRLSFDTAEELRAHLSGLREQLQEQDQDPKA